MSPPAMDTSVDVNFRPLIDIEGFSNLQCCKPTYPDVQIQVCSASELGEDKKPESMTQETETRSAEVQKSLGPRRTTRNKAIVTPIMGPHLNLELRELQCRDPGPGEVMIRIAVTGLCRSDACFSIGPEPGYPKHNHIAGHEGIGFIQQSHDTQEIGQPVALRYLASTCRSCNYCLRNVPENCPAQTNFPKHHAGTFQQYVTTSRDSIINLPPWVSEVTPSAGGLSIYAGALCSGSTAWKALCAAKIRPQDVVVIIGIAGAIGHFAGLMARNVLHAKVVGVDFESKADEMLGRGNDACDVFLPAPIKAWDLEERRVQFLHQLWASCDKLRSDDGYRRGADAVIVAGSTAEAFDALCDYVCEGGSIVCVGVPRGNVLLSLPLQSLVERQIKLCGTLMGSDEDMLQVMEFIRSGLVVPWIEEIELEDIPKYMGKLVASGTIGKIVARLSRSCAESAKD